MTHAAALKALIYLRISVDRDGRSASPETQEVECRAFCERHGWEVAGVYCDRDRSAFKSRVKRPEFDRLMADMENGRGQVLVAYKLDRLTRGGITAIAPILGRLRAVNAHLAFVHDPIDTTQPGGEIILGVLAGLAKQESENTSLRVRSAIVRDAKKGAFPVGGSRQFGYMRNAAIVEEEAETVKEVASRVVAGQSLRSIASDLNSRGVLTTSSNQWSSQSVRQMIRSPRLAGLRKHGKEIYVGIWEPILTREQHLAVLDALDRPLGVRRSVQRHLLTGFAMCGICGRSLKTMGFVMRNGESFPRYQCVKRPGSKNCGGIAVTKHSLDAYVTERTLDCLTTNFRRPLSDDEEHLDRLKKQRLMDDDNRSQLIEERFVRGTIPQADYVRAREKLDARIAALDDQIAAGERQRDVLAPIRLRLGDREDLQLWWDEATIEDQRAALVEAVSKVVVNPAKHKGGNQFDSTRVDIQWRRWHIAAGSEAGWDARREQMSEEERQAEDEALRADYAASDRWEREQAREQAKARPKTGSRSSG